MGPGINRLAISVIGILTLLSSSLFTHPSPVNAQMQQWQQEELARQNYQKQQWIQWQREQQVRQMYDRQQQLQWQQQEKLRQMYQR